MPTFRLAASGTRTSTFASKAARTLLLGCALAALEGCTARFAGTPFRIECAPEVPPDASAGVVFGAESWTGFSFEVPAPEDHLLVTAGIQIVRTPDEPGTIFVAIVRLTGPGGFTPDLSLLGADVVATEVIAVEPGWEVVSGPLDVVLQPGWYSAMFGTGAFGALLDCPMPSGCVVPSAGLRGCVSQPMSPTPYPQSIFWPDGPEYLLRAAEAHVFVELVPER